MATTRLANALWARQNSPSFRYTLDVNIHEAIDPDCEIWVLDHVAEGSLRVTTLLEQLPEYERNLALNA
jgi:hypothetical protein